MYDVYMKKLQRTLTIQELYFIYTQFRQDFINDKLSFAEYHNLRSAWKNIWDLKMLCE